MSPAPILAVLFLSAAVLSTSEAAAPDAPLGAAMVANSPDSITLAWYRAPKNDATSYNVYTSSGKDGPFTKFATVTERTAIHAKLHEDTPYFYKVAAVNEDGEGELSAAIPAFTIKPVKETLFPVQIAKNMCLSLDQPIVCDAKPISGKLTNLVDGSDATGCRLRKAFEAKIRLNPDIPIADAAYLLIHFRTDCGPQDWSNDKQSRTLKSYVVLESHDSTDGENGTWKEVTTGTNGLLDGVIVIPNTKPKWIGLRSRYTGSEEVPKADDKRPMPSDLILCRLDIFRAAPAGFRNDYWIFTGDSLVVQDMPGGGDKDRRAWFSDLIRQQHPDRYPIVVHAARGGEMLKDTLPRTKKALAALSPPNGTPTPTATMVCWESGFNNVGVGGSLGLGTSLIDSYEEALAMCESKGLIFIPVRLEYSTGYLDPNTLEPTKYNIFYNTLAVNLAGVDVFARASTPYACNPATQMPYADYWTYTRKNHATALTKDGVHHTKEGSDGINRLWADVADKMIYAKQKE